MDGQNKVWTIIMKRGGGKTPFVIGGDWEKGRINEDIPDVP